MKTFFRFLLVAAATLGVARAQSVSLTPPTSPLTTPTTLSGTYSGFSPGPTITVAVSGTATATLTASLSSGTWTANWAPTVVGDYTLRATGTNGTQTASSSSTSVTVANISPTVTLAISPTGVSIPAGSSRYLIATATDDGAIDHVEFYLDGNLIGTSTTPTSTTASTYTLLLTAPTVTGTHQVKARAYDNAGNFGDSSFITFSSTTPVGNPPTVGIIGPNSGAFTPVSTAVPVTLSASDSDGTVNSVQVFANGISVGSATLSGGIWTLNWTPSTVGLFSLTAIATDDKGNTAVAPAVPVNVTDSTAPAISLATTPGGTTLPTGATRNIVATVTPAAGRAVVRVEFFINGAKAGEDTVVPYSFRYTAPATPETDVVSVRATDNAGIARDTQVTFTVINAVGSPPTTTLITPTSNTTVVPNTGVSLAATAIANGGTIASVQFYQNGTPVGSALTAPPFTTSYTPPQPGNYVFDVIATDDRGNTAVSNAATVTAAFATPTVVVTTPNPNATARATPGVPLNLAATATAGTGSSVLLVEFLLDGVQIGADTTAPYTTSWTPTVAQLGTHVLTARVTDTFSQTATSNPVNVVVANVVGAPPTMSVSVQPSVNNLQTVSTTNFIATAIPNGTGVTLTGVEFYLNDVSVGTATREQTTNIYRLAYDFNRFDFTTVTPNIDPNTGVVTYPLKLYAIARDSNGNQTVAPVNALNLTLNSASSAPPTISLIAPITTVSQGTPVPILPNFNDPDGNVVSVQLYANGQPTGGASVNPVIGTLLTYNATTAGRFNLYAIATDDTGNTAVSAPVVINVTAVSAPVTTLTRPADDSTVTTVGAPVFLEGTAVNNDSTAIPTLTFVARGSGANQTSILGTRIGTTTTYRAVWTPTVADTYTVTTQASVTGGAQGTSAVTRKVLVNNVVGIAPTVSISVPSSATSVSTVNLTATATAAGGGAITSVEFFVNRNSIGHAVRDQLNNTWRMTTSFVGLPTGSTEVVALARDSAGNVAASPTSIVNLTTGTGAAPSVTVFANPTSVALGQFITLTATASSSTSSVASVTYFANATNLGGRTTPPSPGQAGYQLTWTNAAVGTYNIYAVAADTNGNTNVSAPVQVTVRRFSPLIDDDAFVLQSYVDISNINSPNLDLVSAYGDQLAAGTLTRAQLINTLITNDTGGFNAPVNVLAAYYAIMGEWPTSATYTSLLATARGSLANAIGTILSSSRYSFLYANGIATSSGSLTSSFNASGTGFAAFTAFATRLWQNAGLGAPSQLQLVQFQSNNVLSPTLGRGYAASGVGLNQAIAEFITNTNSTNTAFQRKALAAALYYQLDKPATPADTSDIASIVGPIATRINQLLTLPDTTSMADSVLKDILYTYRYVTIVDSPQSLVVAPRSGAIFRSSALGAPPISYQWLFNGVPIAGATNSLLSLTNVDATRAGTYNVLVQTSYGSATSDPATLTLSSTPTKLANISTRGQTGPGANVLIAGFVVTGNANQTRQMLIRVVGPTLATQGLSTGLLADPTLEVFAGGNTRTPVLTNDDWRTQAGGAAQVTAIQQATNRAGTFALPNNSLDSAVLATLAPGLYTVQATTKAGASGLVLIEVYDVTVGGPVAPKAVNVSTRGNVGTGSNVLIAGFVVSGAVQRRLLIRGAGPTLSSLGIPSAATLADPQITLSDQSTGKTIQTNNDWASGDDAAVIAAAAQQAGAFPLANGSKDAAMILMLSPGAYTVQLSGVNNTTGIGIVEVYDVDP